MKKQTLLLWLVGLLVVLNLATLGFLVWRRPPHGGPRQADRLIVETLGLDAAQRARFEVLKRGHHEQIVGLDAAYARTSAAYFRLLDGEATATQKDSLEQELGRIQARKAAVTFAHFEDLKLLRLIVPNEKKMPPPEGRR